MRRDHPITTSARTGVLTVIEHDDRIDLRLTFDVYGDLGDDAEVRRQLLPLMLPFDNDPRPLRFHNQHSGQVAMIDVTEDGTPFAVIREPTRQ